MSAEQPLAAHTANSIDTPAKEALDRPETIIQRAVGQLRAAGDPQLHRLKRGTELLDAMLEPVFVKTKQQLRAHKFFVSDDLLAVALLISARLSAEPGNLTLGVQLQRTGYSEMRFASLVRCEDPAELFTNLQRAVRFCKDKAEPFDLLRLVLGWTENRVDATRKKLVAQYYSIQ